MLFIGQVQGSRPEHSVPALGLELHVYQLSPWLFQLWDYVQSRGPKGAEVVAGAFPLYGTQGCHSLHKLCTRCQAVLWAMSTSCRDFQDSCSTTPMGSLGSSMRWHHAPQVSLKPCQMKNGHSLYNLDFCHGHLSFLSPGGGEWKAGVQSSLQ